MKLGTRSLLFGVHQFLWHPFTVWLAWVKLYGSYPTWRECVCIIIHDFGYWGCKDMDGPQGQWHPYTGARIALKLFGSEHANLVLLHSRTLAARMKAEPSKLCWADKCSMLYDPQWFYLFRARLTGELKEYRQNAETNGFISTAHPDWVWHEKLCRKIAVLSNQHRAQHLTN